MGQDGCYRCTGMGSFVAGDACSCANPPEEYHAFPLPSKEIILLLVAASLALALSGCHKEWRLVNGTMCRDIAGGQECETRDVR